MNTLFLAIVSITVLYFFLALTRLTWRLFKVHVCVICAAICLTWLWLLAMYLRGANVDPIVLAILMGATLVAVTNRLQEIFLSKGWRKYWVIRWFLIILGLVFLWALLNERWWLVIGSAAVTIVGGLLFYPSIKTSAPTIEVVDMSKETEEKRTIQQAKEDFEKKMKECCD